MGKLNRREFVKKVVAGGLAYGLGNAVRPGAVSAASGGPVDIGQCRSLKVTCVSEVASWDRNIFRRNMWAGGGPGRCDQWNTAWDLSNGAGFCALIEVDGLDGKRTNIIFDVGWNPAYIARRLETTGAARLLRQKTVDWLVVSHEHADHFWGLEAVLGLDPEITVVIPDTFRPEGLEFIAGRSFEKTGALNKIKHQGRLMSLPTGQVHRLQPGIGVVGFDGPLIFKVRGEQSLIFNVLDKGLVLVTGCCHQTIITFIDYAGKNVKGDRGFHGLYGGLHLAPYDDLGPFQAQWIRDLARYGFDRLACNHCTGVEAVKMMKSLGYPVVEGRGADGSRSSLYLGNGDTVMFG